MKVSIEWSTRRDGNSGYVLEQRSDGSNTEFGPMPAHVVPAFVEARRRVIAMMMEREGHTHVDEEFDPALFSNPN